MHETSDHSFAADKEFSHSVVNPSQAFFLSFSSAGDAKRASSSFSKVEIFRPADG